MDLAALDAGEQLIAILGAETPARSSGSSSYPTTSGSGSSRACTSREDGQALAEVLADVEEDLTGKTRERAIAGLRVALD